MKLQLHIHALKICRGSDHSSSLPRWAAAMVKRCFCGATEQTGIVRRLGNVDPSLAKSFLTGAVSYWLRAPRHELNAAAKTVNVVEAQRGPRFGERIQRFVAGDVDP